ncbi:MAG: pentapeptide repeat-containing protein [Cyanobacteria bacterium P01_D01_bin.115]
MLAFERQKLFDTLSALPPAQFAAILFTLHPPSGTIPDDTAAQGKRVEALLQWADGPGGVGLQTVQEVLYQTIGKTAPPQTTICPYKGLSYFDCNDRDYHYFYGRETLTQTLLEKIEQENFLAIVGASGSGKSSVLRAGLLQHLKDCGDSEIRILVPGEQPLQNLGLAFVDETLERLERAHQLQTVDELMRKGATGLASLVRTSPKNRTVLVVDQFEEAFTLCHDLAERQAFFTTLLGALAATDRLRLILAMRSDFVGKCFEADYSGLATQVKTHLEPVLPMSPAELTQAITAPARQVGILLEPGLVEALQKDVDPTSGSLPLLQYTLTELWQRQQDHQLKLSTYMQLGGVTGTLQQRADTVYTALTPEQQRTAKHIFLSLTQLGEGAEDTRHRITQTSLISAQHPEAQVVAVVKQLADANLVVTDDRTLNNGQRTAIIDVAHEALIRNWPKLRTWLDENRDLLRQQRKIEQAAAEWSQQPYKQQKRYLLEGRQLTDAQIFCEKQGKNFDLSIQAVDFINQSLRKRRLTWIKFSSLIIMPLTVTYFVVEPTVRYERIQEAIAQINQGGTGTREAVEYLVEGCAIQQRTQLPNWLMSPFSGNCVSLSKYDLVGYDLRDANLEGADLLRANLSGADLTRANLSGANLDGANLHTATLRFANLRNTTLFSANLVGTDLRGVNLSDADLGLATIIDVDFGTRDLTVIPPPSFQPTILSNVDFTGAVVLGTNLSQTEGLRGAQFNLVKLCNAPLPSGANITGGKDRDCSKVAATLQNRGQFDTIEQAEEYVENHRSKSWLAPSQIEVLEEMERRVEEFLEKQRQQEGVSE